MNVQPLFSLMVEKNASDLFLTCHAPVKIKIDGKIMPVNKLDLTPKMIKQAVLELMTEAQIAGHLLPMVVDRHTLTGRRVLYRICVRERLRVSNPCDQLALLPQRAPVLHIDIR